GGLAEAGRSYFGGFASGGYRARRRPPLMIDGEAQPVARQAPPRGGFESGERVFHQKFGYGTVRAADDNKLEIAFDKAGTKKVLDSFVIRADAL
ncbi:MAG: hypothetical protein V3R98_10905, partial [Alphaproteobacteria bacterium]